VLISMTGYCSKNLQITLPNAGTMQAAIEIKTLNGRFFEVVSKLPSSLSRLELIFNALLQEKLVRGRVYLSIRQQSVTGKLAQVNPSWAVIEQYVQAAKAMQQKYGLTGELSVVDVMRMPEALLADESVMTEQDEQALLAALSSVVDSVVAMRREEGARLEKDFQAIFVRCAERLAAIKAAFADEVAKAKAELNDLMQQHAAAGNEQRPEVDEMQSALRKMDIHEEIVRFASHLDSVKPLLDKATLEKGKRLDFILQELLRETNTMMAKCLSYAVSAACIDIKVDLEKAREQVQNIL